MLEVLVSVDKVHSWRKSKREDSSGYWANAIVRSSRTFTYGGNIETVASPPYGQGGLGKKKIWDHLEFFLCQ